MSFSKKLEQISKMYRQGRLSKSEFSKAQNEILDAEMGRDFSPDGSMIDAASLQMRQEWEKKRGKGFEDSRYSRPTAPSLGFVFYHFLTLIACIGIWTLFNWASSFHSFFAAASYAPLVIAAATLLSAAFQYESYKAKLTYYNGNKRYIK